METLEQPKEGIKIEQNRLTYSCTVCDDTFVLSEELTYHYMTHSLVELAHALTEIQARLEERESTCSCKHQAFLGLDKNMRY